MTLDISSAERARPARTPTCPATTTYSRAWAD
ncbi:Uncharacterised protein [Bordetella pertussis]|nr:Uncharacterised protein [Bordetella pertussis]